ncbi:2-hydroxyacid dehydrogenase [Enterococcus sp. AZ163]|uniref:2-hydroxyacid dehydrogenase n=1 Tax=Enterococcus sp. AZ163 TaxID=2774638 RepID=UPI003D2C5735
MKVVVIGDALVKSETLIEAVKEMAFAKDQALDIVVYEWHSELSKDEFQEHILAIERGGPEAVEIPEGILADLPEADYLFCHYAPISKAMLEAGKKLKLIGTCRGGIENVHVETVRELKLPFLHVIRNAEPVADFTVGLMYAETRNIARAHAAIKNGKWEKSFANDPYKTILPNLTVGIVGVGYIGKQVIERLNGLKVPVIVYDPFVDQQRVQSEGLIVKFVLDLAELFQQADIISLHMRVTEETKEMVNQHYLKLMKPGSYLINTARADLVCKDDLIKVLAEKKIAGAALDVSWTEPITADDPLLKLDNVTLTPHIAGDTIDAIPRSPFLLKKVVNDYLAKGYSDMEVR